ncbi:DUF4352 domain-containing protein [Aquibacillus salsiterrae]|uniref:DUF4352 domain-containing protein n=1 Tax=Aquibacillus salsiterrae TaxID=2950439 RepID=A0A9X3WFR5_9BACI|nr:DUF4352 domain-containing protein [Aquibacillus salsiterrae]MDC3417510.1 DUF4352 domain-containing protein [Aquibacillus salsiterrae]
MGEKVKVKKPFYKKWWVWVLAIIIVAAIAGGGGEDTAEPASTEPANTETSSNDTAKEDNKEEPKEEPKEEEKKAFGLGQEVAVENLTYIVNGVEEQTEIKREYMDNITTSGKFLIIDLTIKNNDKEARFIDSEMFRLVDADGTEFSSNTEADMYINNGDLGFFMQEINPKMDMTGKVAFEVPADATDLQLQVSSGFGWSGGKYEVINLK